eukprot:15436944-Alexandrium_andersonii.AAC.1
MVRDVATRSSSHPFLQFIRQVMIQAVLVQSFLRHCWSDVSRRTPRAVFAQSFLPQPMATSSGDDASCACMELRAPLLGLPPPDDQK